MGMRANGASPSIIKDFINEAETPLAPIAGNMTILLAGYIKRFIIECVLKWMNKGRVLRSLEYIRLMSPENFEKLLKERYIFCYEFAKVWKETGVTAIISPLWPHVAPKEKDVID